MLRVLVVELLLEADWRILLLLFPPFITLLVSYIVSL